MRVGDSRMASMAQGTQLSGSVGKGGRNKPIDIAEVGYLLRQSAPDPVAIDIDGVADPDLLTGIVDFQIRALIQDGSSGLIKPRDAAAQQLSFRGGALAAAAAATEAAAAERFVAHVSEYAPLAVL